MMSCWCGHGPWHHYGHAYPPPAYPLPGYPAPEYARPYWEPGGRRRRTDEELERHLAALEEEIARLREELAAQRRSGDQPG
ncbi:hypothetical protein ACL02T_08565 [Pseudonocardia sp. RS010]|uniref:hypothetical protein n=1 Tax=Pseudonocardia sp. RS010 TaxID=3385979 RepID=UPI0039A1623A